MFKQPIAIALFVAFYTIFGACASIASGTQPQSARLLSEIESTTKKMDRSGIYSLIADYIYALEVEGVKPAGQLRALCKLCPKNQNLNYWVAPANWLTVLRDFHINSFDDLQALHDAVGQCNISLPSKLSCADAKNFLNLASEVEKFEMPSNAPPNLKAETLIRLAKFTQYNKAYARQLENRALAQAVKSPSLSDENKRLCISMALQSYSDPQQQEKSDGPLLVEAVSLATTIARENRNLYLLQWLEPNFPELFKRCSRQEAVSAMQQIVDAASSAKIEPLTAWTLQWQLGCAYMLDTKWKEAEGVFRKIDKTQPTDRLCLAECLRMQKRFGESDEVARAIQGAKFSESEQHPEQYIAIANAIRAQGLIDRGNFSAALPLLLSADKWYDRNVNEDSFPHSYRPFVWAVLPNGEGNLSNLMLVYHKLGKGQEYDATAKKFEKAISNREATNAEYLKSYLDQTVYMYQPCGEDESGIAKLVIDVCSKVRKTPDERVKLLLEYIESLIKRDALKAAEMCLDSCKEKPFAAGANNKDATIKMQIFRLMIATQSGNVELAKQIGRDILASAIEGENKYLFAEALAQISIYEKDFAKAEEQSRIIESEILALPSGGKHEAYDSNESEQDKFISKHQYAIVNRVQCLTHLKRYEDAAVLCRLLLAARQQAEDALQIDVLANLAVAYQNTSHFGLSKAAQQQAEVKLDLLLSNPQSRFLKDAYAQLTQLDEVKRNELRYRRYQNLAEPRAH